MSADLTSAVVDALTAAPAAPWPPIGSWAWWSGFGMQLLSIVASVVVSGIAVGIAVWVAQRDRKDRLRRQSEERLAARDRVFGNIDAFARQVVNALRTEKATASVGLTLLIGTIRDSAREQGFGVATMQPLVSWTAREMTATEDRIAKSKLNPQPGQWTVHLAWSLFEMAFWSRLSEWRDGEKIDIDSTVADQWEEMRRDMADRDRVGPEPR